MKKKKKAKKMWTWTNRREKNTSSWIRVLQEVDLIPVKEGRRKFGVCE